MKELLYLCLRVDFLAFIHKCFITLNPGQTYVHNWHIDVIIYHLNLLFDHNSIRDSCSDKVNNRLLINIPPRNLKSLLISVIWVAWLLGHNPKLKIIVVTYSQRLSDKHHYDTSLIMNTEWYLEVFKIKLITNNRFKLVTSDGGFRLSTSVGASLTGEGGDIIIIDDPHNPAHIYSNKRREFVINWYKNILLSRFNNYSTGKLVVVMQRLHVDDLSGYLLLDDNFIRVIISIISDYDIQYSFKSNKVFNYKQGMLLDVNRYTYGDIDNLREVLGNYCFLAQYMQKPLNIAGLIPVEIIQFYSNDIYNVEDDFMIIHSWDTAASVNDNSDYSVCTVWLVKDDKYYLLDCIRERVGYNDLLLLLESVVQQYKPTMILIENKSTGISLIQHFSNHYSIVSINSKFSKQARVDSCLNMFKYIVLPKQHILLSLILEELSLFPNAKYDDIVDSVVQFLIFIQDYNDSNIRII